MQGNAVDGFEQLNKLHIAHYSPAALFYSVSLEIHFTMNSFKM